MIATLIRWSITNRFLVLVATAFLVAAGIWSASRTPVDALPDLSDVQVIVRTTSGSLLGGNQHRVFLHQDWTGIG